MQVAVIGAGSWGTTVAAISAARTPTLLWARRPELADAINARRENPDYLAGHTLPDLLTATADLEARVAGADVVVMGVPSHGYRQVLGELRQLIAADTPILSLTKGIEQETLMRMTEVTTDVLPDHRPDVIGVLTGPNLAKEVVAGQPAATVVAVGDEETARSLQAIFISPTFRVYTNDDVIGSEAAGALKNVMAIAAGMANGLGFGDNTMATLITRALAEVTRLGHDMGGRTETFAGLAGMGDLIATCMSSQSRNHRVGYGLGRGEKLEDIIAAMNMVAEGVKTSKVVMELAEEYGLDLPIATEVHGVCHGGRTAMEAYEGLLDRGAAREMDGITPAR